MTEVRWTVGPATVEGTLQRSRVGAPRSGVVFAAGSGPTDRDWNSPLLPGANGSGRLLAEALADAGMASVRYDKLAAGPHALENIRALGGVSMKSHVDEFAGAVRALAADGSVAADRIYGLGNSEGTLHVLDYQLQAPDIPLAGMVLIAPPGRPVGAVARSQLAAQATRVPGGDVLMGLYDQSIERFLGGEPTAPDPSLPEGVQTLLHSLENPANLPFARELWTADASSLLADVDVPTLVVIGKKDIQVSWTDDGMPLQQAAAGNTRITFAFPEDANHVLKYEPRPRDDLTAEAAATAYNADDAHLDEAGASCIIDWLVRAASR